MEGREATIALHKVAYIVVDQEKLEDQAAKVQAEFGFWDWTINEITEALLVRLEENVNSHVADIREMVDYNMERELDRIAARRDKPCKCVHFAGDLSCCPKHGVAIEDAPEVGK